MVPHLSALVAATRFKTSFDPCAMSHFVLTYMFALATALLETWLPLHFLSAKFGAYTTHGYPVAGRLGEGDEVEVGVDMEPWMTTVGENDGPRDDSPHQHQDRRDRIPENLPDYMIHRFGYAPPLVKHDEDRQTKKGAEEPDDDSPERDQDRQGLNHENPRDYTIRQDPYDTHHRNETEGLTEDSEDSSFMQQPGGGDNAWLAYLAALRERLEQMGKADRSLTAQALLNRLDWHATNTRAGYWLGHMPGQTSELTALLVAAHDGVEANTTCPLPDLTEGLWAEAERFLAMHPGSRRAMGQNHGVEMPAIMAFPRAVPTNTPTGSSPGTPLVPEQPDRGTGKRP